MDIKAQKFLIIDDHFLIFQAVSRILKDLGAETVDRAANGDEGLASLRKAQEAGAPYTTIFLDWSMPGLSGYDVLLTCRKDKNYDALAIIMLSAETEDTNIVKALDAGATAYITKPFKPDVFLKKLDDVAHWRKKMKVG